MPHHDLRPEMRERALALGAEAGGSKELFRRGLMFAIADVAIQVGRAAFAFVTLRASLGVSHPLTRTFQRALSWHVVAGVLWISGGLLGGEAQYVLWILALAVAYSAPMVGYYIPGLGRSRTSEWPIEGGHFAHRCRLFIIIALGESLLVTGTRFGEIAASLATVLALVVAFVGSLGLWWIYFERSEEAAREIISSSEDPGRLARSAYTFFHQPMIAGIIVVAASDDLVLAHAGEHGTPASVALILGGTALFLAGHAFFEWSVFRRPPFSHMIAIAVLAVLVPVGFAIPTLALSGATGLVVVSLAVWETLAYEDA